MTHIEIIRIEATARETIGILKIDGETHGFTLELPRKANKRQISCIPTGEYFAKHYYSEKHERICIALHNVFERSFIAIHNGNTKKDTQGCILVGSKIGHVLGERAVLESKNTLSNIIISSNDVLRISIKESF